MTVRDSAGAKGMEREGGRVGWGCRSGVHDRVWVEFHTWRSARSGGRTRSRERVHEPRTSTFTSTSTQKYEWYL